MIRSVEKVSITVGCGNTSTRTSAVIMAVQNAITNPANTLFNITLSPYSTLVSHQGITNCCPTFN